MKYKLRSHVITLIHEVESTEKKLNLELNLEKKTLKLKVKVPRMNKKKEFSKY